MKEPFEIEWCGGVAEKHFRRLRPEVAANWKNAVPAASAGFHTEDLHGLGRLDADAFGQHARRCVRDDIVPNLARFGIEIPNGALERLLA